eukprot:COSAG01_NODE_5755_length_4054_cov_11.104930_3_plen_83_part_00
MGCLSVTEWVVGMRGTGGAGGRGGEGTRTRASNRWQLATTLTLGSIPNALGCARLHGMSRTLGTYEVESMPCRCRGRHCTLL